MSSGLLIGVLADQMIEKEEFEGVKIENSNNDIYVPLQTLLRRVEPDPVENELDEIVIRPESQNLAERRP